MPSVAHGASIQFLGISFVRLEVHIMEEATATYAASVHLHGAPTMAGPGILRAVPAASIPAAAPRMNALQRVEHGLTMEMQPVAACATTPVVTVPNRNVEVAVPPFPVAFSQMDDGILTLVPVHHNRYS